MSVVHKEKITEMENIILKCWFGGYNRRDWPAVQGIYTEDALIHAKDGLRKGGKAVVALAKEWLETIPDAQITPLHTSREENDVVVVHWRSEGTVVNSDKGIAATGTKTAFHGLSCFRCSGQKVIEHWVCVDYRPLKGD